jgi:3-dehydroquinate synthase
MTAPTRITLIGFSGGGKSTVARLVAERLGWQATDSDALIEKQAGKPVASVFTDDGEAVFRGYERAVFASLRGERLVVAAGGGATLLDETRRLIVEAGLVVCLEATAETVVARLSATGDTEERPLLAGPNPLARVQRLKTQRAPLYALADFTVHTDALSPEAVAAEVVRLYETHAEAVFNRPGRVTALTAAPPALAPLVDGPGAATIVRTASGEYPAYADWGGLERLGEHTKRATGARRAFLISDANVLSLWGETAVASLRGAGIETAGFSLDPGDSSKSIENAGRVYEWLASQRAERRDAVVALGGGMVGDFAGFVAGTYLRGLPLIQAPTSLLAMVDASIGGKTAVNLGATAKNLVGLFYQPKAVVADVSTLKTLPRRELVEGLGEVIKHALIRDPELLDLLDESLDDLLKLEPGLTTDIIRRNVQIKAAVVSEDERETGGVREILNYGHTLGHAFEAAGGYEALLHGEAVSCGMVAAAEIGARIGVTPRELVERQNKLIERAGLPLRPPPGLDRERIRAALALDKKVVSGGQRWVLLEDAGRAVVRSDVPVEIVEAVLDELLS